MEKEKRTDSDPYEPTYDERKNASLVKEWAKIPAMLVPLAEYANKLAELYFPYEIRK